MKILVSGGAGFMAHIYVRCVQSWSTQNTLYQRALTRKIGLLKKV